MNKASLNKVILIGRLGKDPEQRVTQGNLSVANFSIATTDSRKVNDQYQDTTEWHNCVSFGKQAEYIANYFRKGQMVCVEGKLKTSNWDKDGVKHYKTEIFVESATALERGDLSHDSGSHRQTPAPQPKAPQVTIPLGRNDGVKAVEDAFDDPTQLPF